MVGVSVGVDVTTNLQQTQPDWAAMSMMDMFAQSVRKLTSDNDSPSNAAVTAEPAGSEEPQFQRRALPRMQAVMAKRNNMQAKKSSRTLMTSFAEEEEEEESSHHDNSQKMDSARSRSLSPHRRQPPTKAPSPAPSPIRRPVSPQPMLKRDSASDDDIQPKELPATSSPIQLDLSHKFKASPPIARELPVLKDKPMKLDLTHDFKGALPIEPKCLDDELSASQRPMPLDMNQKFHDLPIQPKCLDADLSAGQRMHLDLSNNFQEELPLEPKCLDDSNADNKSMKLDLSGKGDGELLFHPKKNLDGPHSSDIIGSRKMDESSARARRRHHPPDFEKI